MIPTLKTNKTLAALVFSTTALVAHATVADEPYGEGGPLAPVQTYDPSSQASQYATPEPDTVILEEAPDARPVTARRGWRTKVSGFAEAAVTVSDNINLAPDGYEKSGVALTTTLGATASVEGPRLSGGVGYTISHDSYLSGPGEDGLRHGLNADAGATLVPGLLYLDAGGAIAESLVDADGRYSLNPVAAPGERDRVFSAYVSPSLRKNLGGWANAELRYSHSRAWYENDAAADDYSNVYSAALTADPRKFRRFGWTVSTVYQDYGSGDGRRDAGQWTSGAGVEVPVAPKLAALANAGYDHFSEPADDDALGGVYGNVGLRYSPTRRLNTSASVGYRYGGFDYNAALNYMLRERLSLGINAGRQVTFSDLGDARRVPLAAGRDANGQPLYRAYGGGITDQLDEALAVDGSTGELGRYGDPGFASQSDTAVIDTLSGAVSGDYGRTRFQLGATSLWRDYRGPVSDEWLVSGTASVTRDLTPRIALDAGATLGAYRPEDTALADEETFALGLGASYHITDFVNAFARYTHTRRFSDDPLGEYGENAGVVGLRASF